MSQDKLFGSSGIRGDAKQFFTDQLCFDLGRTFSLFLKNHEANADIAIGMDPRESSQRIKDSFIKGLVYEKRKVFYQGVVPIPSINWVIKSLPNFSGGVMVTGSHIKAHLNGLKFFAFGEEILKIHEEEIQSIYLEIRNKIKIESFDQNIDQSVTNSSDAKESYVKYLLSNAVESTKKLKIVVDPGNGAQSYISNEILTKLGHEVFMLNADINKPLLSRDTEVQGDFQELQNKVLELSANLGIGYDSDGDRVIFIDEKGQYISGDYSCSLISTAIDTQTLVTPVNTSQVVEDLGKRVERTRVGSPFVVAKMKEVCAGFGFEANGGGIFNEMHSRDGGRSTIEFLNLLAKNNLSVSDLVSTLPKYFILRDKVDYELSLKDKIMNDVRNSFKGIKMDETDGLKIWIDQKTWILFRSSANAPEFRVFVESDTMEKAQQLFDKGLSLVRRTTD